MIRKVLTPTLLILALLFVVACGGGSSSSGNAETAPTASSGATNAEPTAAPQANTRPTTAEVAEPTAAEVDAPTEVAVVEETRDIKDIGSSLDGLESYRLQFTFSFDGKDEQGKAQKGSMQFVQEVIKASKDRHISFTATGDATGASGKGGSFDFYQVGGTTYIYAPEGEGPQKCIGTTSSDASTGSLAEAFKPSDIVGGLEKAKLVAKGETINGVVTDRYSFDQSAISFGAFASAQGEAWIAQDGGFVVKYVGTATGKNNALAGKMGEGTFTWEYNVEDANQVEAIELPKECAGQKPAEDLPVPPNATDKSGFGQTLTFKTSDAPADVAAFYKKELTAQGWKAGEENAMGDLQMLSFSKEQRKLSITITKGESGGSTVLINEEKGS